MLETPDTIDDTEDEPRPRNDVWSDDPISLGLESIGFIARHQIAGCVERFEGSTAYHAAEMFDRFYFQTPHGKVLVDVLDDYDGRLAESRRQRHCDFKERWCAENGLRYLPLPESQITPDKIRRLVEGAPEPQVSQPASQRKPAAAKRGQIQRPKAAA